MTQIRKGPSQQCSLKKKKALKVSGTCTPPHTHSTTRTKQCIVCVCVDHPPTKSAQTDTRSASLIDLTSR